MIKTYDYDYDNENSFVCADCGEEYLNEDMDLEVLQDADETVCKHCMIENRAFEAELMKKYNKVA